MTDTPMLQEVRTISLLLPYRLGSVNCYLVQTGSGYVLIDTGPASSRTQLERELVQAGCRPGNLALILLSHGDFDHTGNAAYLRRAYGARVAMHRDDLGMVERGDLFFNRSSGNSILGLLSPLLFGFGKSKRFVPDLFVQEGDNLAEYGLDARIIEIAGHSKGSIGLLTASGDLFCGDLLENTAGPALGAIMDEPAAAEASLEKLKELAIQMIYPGHGRPFAVEALLGEA
jgi:hydroxyacylglutathione hydrolase